MSALLYRLWKEDRGQDLIEYALLAATFAVAIAGLVPNVANQISTIFSQVGSVVTAASAS